MPLAQPLLILLTGALASFAVAFRAAAALLYEGPWVAERPGGYEKYSWAFQTKTVYTALTVSLIAVLGF